MSPEILPTNFDENGYKAPTDVFTNIMICPNCNLLNFITENIRDCRFCGPKKSEFQALVEQVYAKNISKQELQRKPRTVESNSCKICSRDHRRENIRN